MPTFSCNIHHRILLPLIKEACSQACRAIIWQPNADASSHLPQKFDLCRLRCKTTDHGCHSISFSVQTWMRNQKEFRCREFWFGTFPPRVLCRHKVGRFKRRVQCRDGCWRTASHTYTLWKGNAFYLKSHDSAWFSLRWPCKMLVAVKKLQYITECISSLKPVLYAL